MAASKSKKPAEAAPEPRWGKLQTEIRSVNPKTLKRRAVNARYMDPNQFKRLVENVRTDGRLTSMPLVTLEADGSLEILSGHHRTEAAIACAFETIEVIVVTTPLDEERRTALQLSHNAVEGQDNPALLAELYNSLGLDAKKFSGLTDDVLSGLDKLSVGALNGATAQSEELSFQFLPEDKAAFEARIDELDKKWAKKQPTAYAARFAEFDSLFDALVRAKKSFQIVNSAQALCVLAELAHERLDQIDAEAQATGEQA